MDELLNDFDNFKISALAKAKLVGNQINNVTIGPHKTDTTIKVQTEKQKRQNQPSKSTPNKRELRQPNQLPMKKIIAELEKERQEKVQEAVSRRINQFAEFTKDQENLRKQQWVKQQKSMIEKMQQQEHLIVQALEQYDQNSSNQHRKLIEYYHNLAERQKKNEEEIQASERRRQLLNSIIDTIKKHQIEFRSTYQEIATILKSCNHEILKSIPPDILKQLKHLPETMDEIIARCKAGRINEHEAKQCAELLHSLRNLKEQIEKFISGAIQVQQAAAESAENITNNQVQNRSESENLTKQVQQVPEAKKSEPAVHKEIKVTPSAIEKYISRSNFKTYSEVHEFLEKYKNNYSQLLSDDSLKQFRFDLKKAVNIPVNAISAVSAQHLTDKYQRLHNLLAGKPVIVGEKSIVATKHPQGVAFCTNLLAEKFVLQGDLMISSNPEAAFCYAAIIVALWNDFPDFGKLLLAHFYNSCPYLVPWYVPRSSEQTNEEYYKSQGYKYIDGIVEKQDKFLKRMTGIMRLYSAIFITKAKRGQSGNPHGISHAWKWLSSILNLEPRLDITATMIHVFLDNVGFAMQSTYKRMFQKIMKFIIIKYMPMLTQIDSGGPVTRLTVMLEEYKTKQSFEIPSGILPGSFW